MKPEEISEAMGRIEDDIITTAGKIRSKGRRRRLLARITTVAACLCLCAAVFLYAARPAAAAGLLAAPDYPKMAPYPDESQFADPKTGEFDDEGMMAAYEAWRDSRAAQQDQPEGYLDGLEDFTAVTMKQFLSGGEGENRLYAPLNLYLALSMLAETAGGTSRQQILDLLAVDTIEALRDKVRALWNANYCDDTAVTSILANSLWLSQDIPFVRSTIDRLAETYYAASYRGELGSDEMNKALQDWLNEQTGGLLKEQAGTVKLDPDTVLALASTIYFRAKWDCQFSAGNTAPDTFHGAAGDTTCDFMHQSSNRSYFWGDRFSAVPQNLTEGGCMWLILPDEGVSPEDLLGDRQVLDLLQAQQWEEECENQKFLTVNLSMPKFDVSANVELSDGLKALGITEVFDADTADFSSVTKAEGVYLSKAQHAVRVQTDEEGLTAAAFTVMAMAGGSMPPTDEVDFVLDRPFLFAVTGGDGAPLFLGIVNQINR